MKYRAKIVFHHYTHSRSIWTRQTFERTEKQDSLTFAVFAWTTGPRIWLPCRCHNNRRHNASFAPSIFGCLGEWNHFQSWKCRCNLGLFPHSFLFVLPSTNRYTLPLQLINSLGELTNYNVSGVYFFPTLISSLLITYNFYSITD